MTRLYLRLLSAAFVWCFRHVPYFAEYAVEYVRQLEKLTHKKILRISVWYPVGIAPFHKGQ